MDDHSLFRESLSRLLETSPELRIAGSCATASEALSIIQHETVDLVLLDYDLGEEQGTVFLDRARSYGYQGYVLMVTAGLSDAATLRALEAGSSGIFLKHSPPAHLVEAIHKVVSGEVWLDSGAIRGLVAGASSKRSTSGTQESLTPRERTVLRGVFDGLTNKEIAANLDVSESSVKATMQQLFDKTGVRTRSQLVRIALEKHAGDWLAQKK